MRVWTYEAAIPLSRLDGLKPQDGKVIRLNFLLRCIGAWSQERSTCVLNRCTFHPTWGMDYSNEVEWGFVAH